MQKIKQLFVLTLITGLGLSCITVGEQPAKRNLSWVEQHQEAAASTVVLNNELKLLPLKNLNQKIASVNLGAAYSTEFDSLLNKYALVTSLSVPPTRTDAAFQSLRQKLESYGTIILQSTPAALQDKATQRFISNLEQEKDVVLTIFGPSLFLEKMDGVNSPIVWAEKESPVSANFAAQLVFGGVAATGKLSKTYSDKYKKGSGYQTPATRLKYSMPEALGISGLHLQQSIDSIVEEAIRERATPGAVVMVVKDGTVIFNKAYGAHTYDNTRPTRIDDIFDLASITKVSATNMAVMRLYEQEKIGLDSTLSCYLPPAKGSNKANMKIRDILCHQAGLPAGVMLPTQPADLSRTFGPAYPLRAADSLFIRDDYFQDVVFPRMLSSKTTPSGKYLYSDLTMYFMKEIVERQAAQPMDQYVLNNLYVPLGMQTAGYLPLNRFDKSRIVPTELDTYFRKSLLQGYVHDGGAAKLGGVAGHAGLFSSANDLAILYQMLLNGGSYGGMQYFEPETVALFTSRQSNISRRGLGFDGYDPKSKNGYPSKLASPKTFGHTGYTGTCVWVDPAENLVYIFLSNRVYPKVSNKLLTLNIRPRIQDAVYKAIAEGSHVATVK